MDSRATEKRDVNREKAGETTPLLDSSHSFKNEETVYRRRWYILALFCACTFHQAVVWNTFGPMAETMYKVYDWDAGTVAMMTAWAPIIVILLMYPFTWLMDNKGLRVACVIGAGSMTLGTAIRCISKFPPVFTYMMHLGALLNGVTEIVTIAAPPLLSSLWFPARQRTTATAIASVPSGFGVGLAFIIGPNLIPLSLSNHANASHDFGDSAASGIVSNSSYNQSDISVIQDRIMYLLYGEFAVAAIIFLLMLMYFPSRPPTPPSPSAHVPRAPYLQGLKLLLKNGKYLLLGGVYAMSNGIYWGWTAVMGVILLPYGITEDEAGWLGFYSIIIGNVAAIPVGIFADKLSKQMKLFLVILYSLSTIGYTVFALQCLRIIPPYPAGLYVTLIVGSIGLNAGVPLFFELACESAYPVAEGIANGSLVWVNNIFTLLFQLVLLKPGIGVGWMNWTMIGSVVVCIPIFLAYKDVYNRLHVDEIQPSGSKNPVPSEGYIHVHENRSHSSPQSSSWPQP